MPTPRADLTHGSVVISSTGAVDTNPVRANLLTYAPYPVTVAPALGPEGRFLATYESQAGARAAVVQLRESLTARPAHYSLAYDAQAGGLSWFVSTPSQPGRPGGGWAAEAAVARQPEGFTTGNEGLGDGRRGYEHGGGSPRRVPVARAPPSATEGGPTDTEMVEPAGELGGGGGGGSDHDSGSDGGGGFGTERPSRPLPPRPCRFLTCEKGHCGRGGRDGRRGLGGA